MRYISRLLFFILILGLIYTACKTEQEIIPQQFQPRFNHEAYSHKLEVAGLTSTALGKAWLEKANEAIHKPFRIESPYAEDFYISDSDASGHGYRFHAMRGHKVDISIEQSIIDTGELFLDVFRIDNDTLNQFTHIASASDSLMQLSFEPLEDGDYIFRFQTELLRGGRFRIEILSVPSLAFPVSGKDNSAIGSLFGAPRDAGKRKHHGIDIFAKRHTPIIAPCDGYIRSTRENELGGRVIWLRDRERGQTLYFAHLEDIFIEEDMVVTKGDTIGTVGNSGNARTTAPHLHFGIYNKGPVDPYHFVAKTRTRLKRELADKSLIGKIVRTKSPTSLKQGNSRKDIDIKALPKNQIIETLGTAASYYRVRLPDLTVGYISHVNIESNLKPLSKIYANSELNIYDLPGDTAIRIGDLGSDKTLNVVGLHENYALVQGEEVDGVWVRVE